MPESIVAAPGRVNLIGEHIDYNDGFVLPLAIEKNVVIAAARTSQAENSTVRIHSSHLGETCELDLNEFSVSKTGSWSDYILGVVAGFAKIGISIPAFEAIVYSDLPIGGGLSSSAALEVASATLLESLTGQRLELKQKSLLCQQAEHEFAGVPCGIMDQFSSVFGRAGKLMLIDCESETVEFVPHNDYENSFLIVNSSVQHDLAAGQYQARRGECDSALSKLGLNSWREVDLLFLQASQARLTANEFLRARHVITEIGRTLAAVDALQSSNWQKLGNLMSASHDSLRDDFEVSCRELDLLVQIAMEIDNGQTVIGSRMTGAGFGGCTVSLVRSDRAETALDEILSLYQSKTGISADGFVTRPSQGARTLSG